MKIESIRFQPGGIFRRRAVSVALSTGNTYRVRRSGNFAIVVPPCQDAERDALGTVYNAVWEWLNKKEGDTLDAGAKRACGRLVGLLEWPGDFTQDTEARLLYVINKITFAENIF